MTETRQQLANRIKSTLDKGLDSALSDAKSKGASGRTGGGGGGGGYSADKERAEAKATAEKNRLATEQAQKEQAQKEQARQEQNERNRVQELRSRIMEREAEINQQIQQRRITQVTQSRPTSNNKDEQFSNDFGGFVAGGSVGGQETVQVRPTTIEERKALDKLSPLQQQFFGTETKQGNILTVSPSQLRSGAESDETITSGVFGFTRQVPKTNVQSSFGTAYGIVASTIGSTIGVGVEKGLTKLGVKGKEATFTTPQFGSLQINPETGKQIVTEQKVTVGTPKDIGQKVSTITETGIQIAPYFAPAGVGTATFVGVEAKKFSDTGFNPVTFVKENPVETAILTALTLSKVNQARKFVTSPIQITQEGKTIITSRKDLFFGQTFKISKPDKVRFEFLPSTRADLIIEKVNIVPKTTPQSVKVVAREPGVLVVPGEGELIRFKGKYNPVTGKFDEAIQSSSREVTMGQGVTITKPQPQPILQKKIRIGSKDTTLVGDEVVFSPINPFTKAGKEMRFTAIEQLKKAGVDATQAKKLLRLRSPEIVESSGKFKAEFVKTSQGTTGTVGGTITRTKVIEDIGGIKTRGGATDFVPVLESNQLIGQLGSKLSTTETGMKVLKDESPVSFSAFTQKAIEKGKKLRQTGLSATIEREMIVADVPRETITTGVRTVQPTGFRLFEERSITQNIVPKGREVTVSDKAALAQEVGTGKNVIFLDNFLEKSGGRLIKDFEKTQSQVMKFAPDSIPQTTEMILPAIQKATKPIQVPKKSSGGGTTSQTMTSGLSNIGAQEVVIPRQVSENQASGFRGFGNKLKTGFITTSLPTVSVASSQGSVVDTTNQVDITVNQKQSFQAPQLKPLAEKVTVTTITGQSSASGQDTSTTTDVIQETTPVLETKPDQTPKQDTVPSLKPGQKPRPLSQVRTQPRPTNLFLPPLLPPTNKLLKRISGRVEQEKFEVFVKSGGADLSIGVKRTQRAAEKLLTKRLRGTISASGFIESKGSPLKFTQLGIRSPEFRQSRVNQFSVVQKKGKRLSTGGETQAIQFFRGKGKSKSKSASLFGI